MKNRICILLSIFLIACHTEKKETVDNTVLETTFEQSQGMQTATYTETIAFYKVLSEAYTTVSLQEVGNTDAGLPLHLVTFNAEGNFNFEELQKDKAIILVNNGIHPGESDGIDATMLFFRDLAQEKITVPKNVVISAIPIYNIGGSLNRNATTRANQNGPEHYGFRGNAQNYDLNRDFIKMDTENAKAFAEIFHKVQPDVFIDNHVSNGADYQYTLTHLFTQHNKLGGTLGDYLHTKLMPTLEENLSKKNWAITPYVNVFGRTPDRGFSQFMDYPRYSTGYTTLYNTLGLMVETHMLKPYKNRVEGTYELMRSMLDIVEETSNEIKEIRKEAFDFYASAKNYPITWEKDTAKYSTLHFKGYEGKYVKSEVTKLDRLQYDTSKPFTKKVKYENYFKAVKDITIPKAYIIPKGWHKVISHLKINNIEMQPLSRDTILSVNSYRIKSYETVSSPYEGHYLHYNTQVKEQQTTMTFSKGDYIIYTNQEGIRYLIETLEPEAKDSFFNWNFFDTILQRKEGFSPYVFEDVAAQLLKENDSLRKVFEEKQATDTNFAKSSYAQLNWIYQQSKHYEKAHLQYPIYKLL